MRRVVFLILTGLIFSFHCPAVFALDWTALPNLLDNPGFETGDDSGWDVDGSWIISTTQVSGSNTVLPHSGSYFFTSASTPGVLTQISQTIDISSVSSIVDAGTAQFDVGFWYQTELYQNIYDRLIGGIAFYDEQGGLIDSSQSGELFSNAWVLEDYVDFIPTGTRSIEVSLAGIRYTGTYGNAFIDDVYLKVAADPVVPEPATMLLLGSGLLGLVGLRRKRK